MSQENSQQPNDTALAVLEKVGEILSEPSRWTKVAFARNAEGIEVDVESPDAACYCFIGAIQKAEYEVALQSWRSQIVRNTVNSCLPTPGTLPFSSSAIVGFNDAPERTFEEVRAVIECAITKRKGEVNATGE
jgi:hypothetical protein